ncbi:MAG: peptide chain release factor 1 [Ideonella sp.]|nr:peptide chain release factor 1 [Ideonella sp.]
MEDSVRQQFERVAMRLAELDEALADGRMANDLKRLRELTREHAQASAVLSRYRAYQQRERDSAQAREWLADPELAAMAKEELAAAETEMARLEAQLRADLIPRDALFAGDLLRMYQRYCEQRGWQVELVSDSPSDLGGYKEVVLRIEGDGAYGRLRFESGGHRVQRVPATESQGRVHTSACTVAVMPEPDEAAEVTLDPADLRIDTFRASGAGGQHVNKTDSAIRITHLPTGLVAECQDDRSQHRNKARAMQVLAARLRDQQQRERSALEAATRKGLIGSGDRSDRIRTYNFPQGRVSDHRVNLTLYKLGSVMDGDLDSVIEPLLAARADQQLALLEGRGPA